MAESSAGQNRHSNLESAVGAFLAHLESDPNRSAHTVGAYRSDLRQFALFLYPRVDDLRLPLSSISAELVRAFRDELTTRGLRVSSVARKLAVLRSFFRYLCRDGFATGNPAANVAAPAVPRRAVKIPPVEQVETALDQVDQGQFAGARDRAILEVFYGCGLMLGELVRLNLSSLDLGEGVIAVSDSGARARGVPYGDAARSALDSYLQFRAQQLSNLDLSEIDVGALFVNHNGRRLHPRTVQRIVYRNLSRFVEDAAAGPRLLRHTCANHMVDAGADAAAVKELLGQTTLTTEAVPKTDLERLLRVYQQAHPRS